VQDCPEKTQPGNQFYSDNCSGICPEAWGGLERANVGYATPYGTDDWTARACDQVREVFETDCEVFFTATGTAANSTAIAHVCAPYHSVICSRTAHVDIGECGAPGFFSSGTKLLLVEGPTGKVDPEAVHAIANSRNDIEWARPTILSVTQSTEYGTVYSINELKKLSKIAHECNMMMHMDGARFANALACLDAKPRELSWEAGVDILCLGGTKNGMVMGEAVVFFDRSWAKEFEFRCKQSGQLASKMRFQASSWQAVLQEGAWLRHARHANRCAKTLAEAVSAMPGCELVFPVQANAIFVKIPEHAAQAMRDKGWTFVGHILEGANRLMCSWQTTDEDIDLFVSQLGQALKA
jgi:threonine aldolase